MSTVLETLVDLMVHEKQQAVVWVCLDGDGFQGLHCDQLVTELTSLRKILMPWDRATEVGLLDALHKSFLTDTTMRLHKTVQCMSTGMLIMAEAATVIGERKKHVDFMKELAENVSPDVPTVEACCSDNDKLEIPSGPAWEAYARSLIFLQTKATESFKKHYQQEWTAVHEKLEALMKNVGEASNRLYKKQFKFSNHIVATFLAGKGGPKVEKKHALTTIALFEKTLPDPRSSEVIKGITSAQGCTAEAIAATPMQSRLRFWASMAHLIRGGADCVTHENQHVQELLQVFLCRYACWETANRI